MQVYNLFLRCECLIAIRLWIFNPLVHDLQLRVHHTNFVTEKCAISEVDKINFERKVFIFGNCTLQRNGEFSFHLTSILTSREFMDYGVKFG